MTETVHRRRLARPTHDDKQLAELLHAVANLNDRLGELQRGIRTLNGAQRLGAGYAPIRAADQVISGSPGRLAGWALSNAGAAAVTVTLFDSADLNGDVLAVLQVPANTAVVEWLLPAGVGFAYGLHYSATGALAGALYTAPAAPIS